MQDTLAYQRPVYIYPVSSLSITEEGIINVAHIVVAMWDTFHWKMHFSREGGCESAFGDALSYTGDALSDTIGPAFLGGMRFPKGGCDSLGNYIRGDAYSWGDAFSCYTGSECALSVNTPNNT